MKKKIGDEEFALVENVAYVLGSELRVSILSKVKVEKIIKKAVLESLLIPIIPAQHNSPLRLRYN